MIIAISIISVVLLFTILSLFGYIGVLHKLRKDIDTLIKKDEEKDAVIQYLYNMNKALIDQYQSMQEPDDELMRVIMSTKMGSA